MAEFTGERLIPGEVDVDLLNEHMARYHFAVRLARGKRVLDAGCGAGYGSAAMAEVAERVTAIDIAQDAVDYAHAHYDAANLSFEQASCAALPCSDGAFDLVVAFEVIEHLEDWREFLREARRVLAPSGQFIVSTPNRLYYTESRGGEGANPFHVHEFDFAEFTAELKQFFPHVSMFLENHVEGVTFQPHEHGHTVEARVDTADPVPDESHFFLAVCAHRPQIGNPTFLYVPRTANVLRERERHIGKLESELATKDQWLDKAQLDLAEFDREHQKLLVMFREQKEELERSNKWAEELNAALTSAGARVTEVQEELARDQENARKVVAGYNAKIAALEQENREKTKWAQDTETRLTAEIQQIAKQYGEVVAALAKSDAELQERTRWALRLEEEKRQLEEQLNMVRASRWIKLGRKVGLGPAL
ncbi:MAG: methyltransferase domain-containing protein [Candidatus Solibacter sp.]